MASEARTQGGKMISYPPINPSWEKGQFQHGYTYETPTKIHKWEWSITFNCWSALVEFADGWRGFTYPKTF